MDGGRLEGTGVEARSLLQYPVRAGGSSNWFVVVDTEKLGEIFRS